MTERIREFANDGFTFPVRDEGPIDGEVVVLLHGFPQTSKSWDAVTTGVHEAGYRTLVFDQRGYAATARPRGRFAYRISALVGDVAALVAAVGSPVHLVGHDWGAVVAWSTAAGRPELVRTLTAVSVPHSRAYLRSLLSSIQALKSYYMAVFQIPWLADTVLRRFPKQTDKLLANSGMDAAALRQVHTDVIDSGALTPAINWYRAMPFSTPKYSKGSRCQPHTCGAPMTSHSAAGARNCASATSPAPTGSRSSTARTGSRRNIPTSSGT